MLINGYKKTTKHGQVMQNKTEYIWRW